MNVLRADRVRKARMDKNGNVDLCYKKCRLHNMRATLSCKSCLRKCVQLITIKGLFEFLHYHDNTYIMSAVDYNKAGIDRFTCNRLIDDISLNDEGRICITSCCDEHLALRATAYTHAILELPRRTTYDSKNSKWIHTY